MNPKCTHHNYQLVDTVEVIRQDRSIHTTFVYHCEHCDHVEQSMSITNPDELLDLRVDTGESYN